MHNYCKPCMNACYAQSFANCNQAAHMQAKRDHTTMHMAMAPCALLLLLQFITVTSVLQGILHSCANAVKQKRLPARPLSHTPCTISACSPPAAVSACPALNVGCQDLQAQCVPNGQEVKSQVQCFVHLGHASTDSLTASSL